MNKTIKLGLILLIFTVIAAGILGTLHLQTKDIIAEGQIEANNEARQEVLPEGEEFEEMDQATFDGAVTDSPHVEEIYEGLDSSGEIVGYTIKTSLSGYSGPVVVMTGINTEGVISGMKVVSNTETPGLGANASNPEFQDQYAEKSADGNIELVKNSPGDEEVEALTGATITSKAVTDSVNEAIDAYNNISK